MALEFPDDFPFNRKPAAEPVVAETPAAPETEPVVAPAAAAAPAVAVATSTPAAPVSAAEPVAVTTTATIAADLIAQSVAQAVVQAVSAQPAPAASPAPVMAAPLAPPEPIAGTVAAAQDAALSRAEGGPPPGMKERRRVPRQTLVAKTTVRSEAQLTVVAAGFVSNISMMGVGFHTRKPLAVGEKYQIRLEVGPMKWASRLRIITCRQNGDTYDIGAEFVGNELASLSRRELAA